MADINQLIANTRPPDLLGQFTQGLASGQALKSQNLANQQTQQQIGQQNRINQLLQGQAQQFAQPAAQAMPQGAMPAGQQPAAQGAQPAQPQAQQPDFQKFLTDADRQNAQLLIAQGDIEGLTKLKSDVLTRGREQAKTAFSQEKDLRKDFDSQSKDFIKVRDAHTRLMKAAENPSPAGDLALVFNYMKVLDPGSTVREGEFATAADAKAALGRAESEGQVVPNFVKSAVDKLTKGTILLPEQRKDFVDRSGSLYQGQAQNQQQSIDRFTSLAENYGLNPNNVVFEYTLPSGESRIKPTDELTEDDMNNMSIQDLEDLVNGLQQ